ncbi:hypothetical protein Tco_0818340 [Tanacetum coccineum]
MGKKDIEEPVPRDLHVVQPYVPPTPFPGHPKKQRDNLYETRETVEISEKIHTKKALEDERDMDDGPVLDEIVHITSLDDDYVALATSPILEKHLNEFREEISDITRPAEKADGNLDLNSMETEFEIISTHNHMA